MIEVITYCHYSICFVLELLFVNDLMLQVLRKKYVYLLPNFIYKY